MGKSQEVEANRLNIVGEGTSVNGDIKSDGDVRIDGVITGNSNIQGKLVIGNKGKVNGEIDCKNAEISGTVEGKLFVKELLSLKSSAVIKGDIKTTRLAIEPNAVFTGTCNMDGDKTKPGQVNDKAKK
ncbi:MAG: bactofilin family protein [Bacteroidales bacterium]